MFKSFLKRTLAARRRKEEQGCSLTLLLLRCGGNVPVQRGFAVCGKIPFKTRFMVSRQTRFKPVFKPVRKPALGGRGKPARKPTDCSKK